MAVAQATQQLLSGKKGLTMATLLDYRGALDELGTLFLEGSISKVSYLITKRAINNQVFKVLKDVYREWPSGRFWSEVREADFSTIAKKVEEFYG